MPQSADNAAGSPDGPPDRFAGGNLAEQCSEYSRRDAGFVAGFVDSSRPPN